MFRLCFLNLRTMKEKIKEIINKGARALKREDKAFILSCAEELQIPHKLKYKCADCFIDLCFQILNAIPEEEQEIKGVKLKKGVRILVNGRPINEATCDTADKCLEAIKRGTPKRYFDFEE